MRRSDATSKKRVPPRDTLFGLVVSAHFQPTQSRGQNALAAAARPALTVNGCQLLSTVNL